MLRGEFVWPASTAKQLILAGLNFSLRFLLVLSITAVSLRSYFSARLDLLAAGIGGLQHPQRCVKSEYVYVHIV